MSIRTLIEINHDRTHDLGKAFVDALQGYLSGGSTRCRDALEAYGIKVIAMRHHSEDFHIPDGIDGLTMSRALSDKQVGTEPAGRSAPNPDAGVVGDLVEALLKEAGHVCDPHVRCPVSVVRGERIPGPPVGPPPYCVLPAGHEGPHRSQHGGPLRGETETLELPQRCLKCRQPWPCQTAALAKYATQGTGGYEDVVLREDSDGKLQVYSSRFNAVLMTFSRSMPERQRREFFARLTATHQPAISTDRSGT